MCVSILVVIIFEKFAQGGWITVVVTSVVIAFAFWVHKHYQGVNEGLKRLDDILTTVPLLKQIESAVSKFEAARSSFRDAVKLGRDNSTYTNEKQAVAFVNHLAEFRTAVDNYYGKEIPLSTSFLTLN